MIPKYCHIFILLLALSIKAIAQSPLDTLYANENQNLALFFPDPIQKAVTGHQGFVFTYNRDRTEQLGLLQAVPGKPSNLLVITANKHVYSFLLVYAKTLPKYNHFVTARERIGTIGQDQEVMPSDPNSTRSLNTRGEPIENYSAQLLASKPKKLATKRKERLLLRLETMAYHADQTYFLLHLHNRSKIDFELGHLTLTAIRSSKKRRAAQQQVPLDIIHIHQRPDLLPYGDQRRFVVVIPKYVTGPGEKIRVRLREKKGLRSIELYHGSH